MKKITFHRTNDNKDYNKISWTKLILFIEHRKHFYVKKKLCLSNTKNYKEIKILIRKLRLHTVSLQCTCERPPVVQAETER